MDRLWSGIRFSRLFIVRFIRTSMRACKWMPLGLAVLRSSRLKNPRNQQRRWMLRRRARGNSGNRVSAKLNSGFMPAYSGFPCWLCTRPDFAFSGFQDAHRCRAKLASIARRKSIAESRYATRFPRNSADSAVSTHTPDHAPSSVLCDHHIARSANRRRHSWWPIRLARKSREPTIDLPVLAGQPLAIVAGQIQMDIELAWAELRRNAMKNFSRRV